ncbi:queuine tRNA-ribosyltransferase catalytic subunit [Pancytospora philotis]|nr:queuine tRNA-ribosyltransferase catalytic subunit [Pancytospora philotis]
MFGDYKVLSKCSTTNARVSTYVLDKNTLHLPVFMPVATYGAMRGVQPQRLEEEIILSNTYHLRNLHRNIKDFMGWEKSMLTDSGGFQIQSLPNVQVVDEGVIFDGRLFTPEDSLDIQMGLGADIMMQLDDVVNPMMPREQHERAITRSIEWLDRAIVHINRKNSTEGKELSEESDEERETKAFKANKEDTVPTIQHHNGQVIFPIIQGGLLDDLRLKSLQAILERKPLGLAIGGLSGGEDKNDFCRTVFHCCANLPDNLPRYLMGVGYPEDVVVCCALGTDMSDCVYPTRTARFGRAFRDTGDLIISNALITDERPIDPGCGCHTCGRFSRAYLATIKGTPMFCMLMSLHNLHYMRGLTARIRSSIAEDQYPAFIAEFMAKRYGAQLPEWIATALKLVNVDLKAGSAQEHIKC